MAFIRRHRIVLVPLFAAVLVGAGAVLMLRGESDEPGGSAEAGGNVSAAGPSVRVQAWQEDVAKRTQHGREYRFIYTSEYTDPETHETVTEQYASTVRERGTNICYRDASGDWVPSVAEWVETAAGFRMNTNSWQVEVPATLGSAYAYTVGGKTLSMRPSYIFLSDGVHTLPLGTLDARVVGQIDENDPSKLVFRDVLGVNSSVDIELIAECASLHQNVVLRSKPSLPVGFSEANTRLYVYTELGLDAITVDGTVSVKLGDVAVNTAAANLLTARNESDPIAFTLTTTVGGQEREEVLHRFVESRVWDATGPANEACAARQLWRNPADSKTYLVESIDYAYLDGATGAITVDYESINGDIDQDEIWTAHATYYVSGDVNIAAGKTLTIEPGTVVKFAQDSGIDVTASGAKIIAKGEPYAYIVFTSDTDDNAGEDLTPGESTSGERSYYDQAIEIGADASADCRIEYCKVAFAVQGILTARRISTPIQHCIIYDCWVGVAVCAGASTTASDVFNCLVRKCYNGVSAWMSSIGASEEISIANCTFADLCGHGIRMYFAASGLTPDITISDNLVTNCVYDGIYANDADYADDAAWDVKYNAFYDNPSGSNYVNIPAGSISNTIQCTADPYESAPTGDYYLNDTAGGGALCRKTCGSRTYSAAGLNDEVFTYLEPTAQTADITETAEWKKLSDESNDDWPDPSDNVAIGYHHCRIDHVIDDTAIDIGDDTNAVTLTIQPGVVVAFNGASGELRFLSSADEDATLTCEGEADDLIILAGKPLVSMEVEAQVDDGVWAGQTLGIRLNEISGDGSEAASIQYTRFVGLDRGVRFEKDSDNEVQHCIFERAHAPLYGWGANKTIAIHNCLSHCNNLGAYMSTRYTSTNYTLTSCTFDRNGTGIVFSGSAYGSMQVADCLFTDDGTGIQLNSDPLSFTADFNAYWDCGPASSRKIWKAYSPYGEYALGENSIQLTKSPYDPAWSVWADQWCLAQDDTYVTPCVDAGHTYASADGVRLERFTTALEGMVDTGTVDIGYHCGGELAGVEKIELRVDGDPIVNAYFSSSHVLQIVIDFANNSGTWEIFVDGETTNQTGTGDMDGETDEDACLDFSAWSSGTYTIRITYDGGDTDDIVFTVYIDNDLPGVTITHPGSTAVVTGY
jgi:hypothetical protein